MNKEEAIEICKKIIEQNNEIVKQTRRNKDINAMQLTANCDKESLAIETVLKALDNSIPKEVIEKEIEELKNMTVDGEVFTTAVNFAIKILQEILREREVK